MFLKYLIYSIVIDHFYIINNEPLSKMKEYIIIVSSKKSIAKIFSATLLGVEASFVKIEVDIQRGLPGIQIIGLADSSVKEAKERVRSSIENSGYIYPKKRL